MGLSYHSRSRSNPLRKPPRSSTTPRWAPIGESIALRDGPFSDGVTVGL